jgi:hypothetical protein
MNRFVHRAKRGMLAGCVASVVAVAALGTGLTESSAAGRQRTSSLTKGSTTGASSSGLAACGGSVVHGRLVFPPVVMSDARPENGLLSILRTFRQPATAGDHIDLSKLNRWEDDDLTVFKRYVRVMTGERGAQVAILPTTICARAGGLLNPDSPPARLLQVVELVILKPAPNNSPLLTPILVGTPADIRSGTTFSGLFISGGGSDMTVVPNGVARVYMHFTPPFSHHYSVTEAIHNNVGIAVDRPGFAPTTIIWYDRAGRRIKTIVHRREIEYDNCLAHHRPNCYALLPGPPK